MQQNRSKRRYTCQMLIYKLTTGNLSLEKSKTSYLQIVYNSIFRGEKGLKPKHNCRRPKKGPKFNFSFTLNLLNCVIIY